MAPERIYRAPPITEAIVEIRLANLRSDDALELYSKKLAPLYPTETINQNLTYNLGAEARLDKVEIVRRRSNAEETELVLLTPSSLFVAQLAPYTGWELFCSRFEKEFEKHKNYFGYSKIVQVGLRYINRIDIEKSLDGVFVNEDFLTLHINLPNILDPSSGYTFSLNREFVDDNLLAIINSAAVLSPLPETMAFILDIDLIRKRDVPQKDVDIFDLLQKMRAKKNEIFEACITDKARQGFMNEARLG